MVSPQLLNAYGVAGTSAADIAKNWTWDFGYFTMEKIGYQAQVIPAMLAGFMLAYLEIFFRKRIPEAVSMIFVPFFSLIPTIIAAHAILGPIGWKIGDAISHVVNAGLTSSVSWLFSLLFGTLYAPLVITGLHHMSNAIDMQLIATYGTTNLWPMIALSNIAQGSAVLAIYFLHRGNKKEEQVSIPSTISAYLGVTEPAMFGINLKYVYPFVAAMCGSGLAGMLNTLMGVRANSIGVGGLPGILAINAKEGMGWLGFLISMAVAIVVPFVLTFVFRNVKALNKLEPQLEADGLATAAATAGGAATIANTDREKVTAATPDTVTKEEIFAPVEGEVVAIGEVQDPVFSQKMMGDGFAVRPKAQEIYAPVYGTVMSVFETKHAIGIKTSAGAEVLVHMGIDTVELQGAPFDVKVGVGDPVSPTTLIAMMDLAQVQAAGKGTDVIVVFTNSEKIAGLHLDQTGEIAQSTKIGEIDVI